MLARTLLGHLDRRIDGAVALLFALPVLLLAYPPMTDLPWHEGMVAVLRHRTDPTLFPQGLYQLNLGHPNQLFHLLSWGLSYVVPVELACKTVVAGSIAGIFLGFGRLLRHLDASPWVSLCAAPVAWGFLFYFGLVANLLGLGLYLVCLPNLDRFAGAPTWRGALFVIAWLALLYLGHESMLLVGCFSLGVLSVVHPWNPRRVLLRIFPLGFATALAVFQKLYERHLYSAFIGDFMGARYVFHSPLYKLRFLPATLVGSHPSEIALLLCALVALSAVLGFMGQITGDAPERVTNVTPPAISRWQERRFLLLGALLFALYAAFPWSITHATMVYERMLPPALLVTLAAVTARRTHSRHGLLAKGSLAALAAVTFAVSLPQFFDADGVHRDLAALFSRMRPGSAVVILHVGPQSEGRIFSATAQGARVLSERGGRLLFSFTESPIAPVQIARERRWETLAWRLGKNPLQLEPACDFLSARYALVHAIASETQRALARAVSDEATVVTTSGEWILLESVLPVRDPGEGGERTCHGETLGERLKRLSARPQI